MTRLRVVICGGGFAALEGLLRLRRLAGDAVSVTLVSPIGELTYRPLTVLRPFTGRAPAQYRIHDITAHAQAELRRDSLSWVDLPGRAVHLAGGASLRYDALLLATGARERSPSPFATIFSDRTGGHTYQDVLDQLDVDGVGTLTLLEPAGPCWALPLYELALLTAVHARRHSMHLAIDVITPHPFPLYPFGGEIGSRVAHLLRSAGITMHTDTRAELLGPDRVRLQPTGEELRPDCIVTLPTLTGPDVRGIPGDALDRFIPVDGRCRVRGTDGTVFAAGDGTNLPIKHGSLAAQQADTAAAGIAHLAGVGPVPVPLHPVLRGTLLTGGAPLYLEAHPVGATSWRATVLSTPPWPADQLVAADELAAYLADPAVSSTVAPMQTARAATGQP